MHHDSPRVSQLSKPRKRGKATRAAANRARFVKPLLEVLEPRRLLTGAPTITPFSEQVVNEDFHDWTVEFTVDDVDTALNDLELTATSSQPNVIANDGLTITGSGTERTLHLRSLPDAWGDTTISVSANDGNASTIQSFQVSVNPTNDPPRFSGLSDTTVTEGSSTRVAFEVTDVETAAEQLTVTATTSHPGSVALQDIVLTQEGQAWTADLTSQSGQFGEVIVSFTAHDGTATSTQSIVANVLPDPTSNHAPRAVSDQFTVAPATTFAESSSAILSNDVDVDGDQLLVELVSDVNHGHLELSTTGDFTYTPNAEFQGEDFFTYRVFDGNLYSAPTTVHLKIASNAPPVAVTDLYATDEDTALWVSPEQGVLANDSDPDSPFLKAVLVSDVEHGTLHFAQDGSFTYEPHPHFAGQDHFAYSVQDDQHVSQTVTATIDVHPVNDAAIAERDNYVATEGTTLSVLGNQSVLSNDTDVDGDALTAIQFDLPQHGQLNFADDGTFTYTPEPGFVGVDHFLYTTSDGTATSNLARVTIEVQPGDDAQDKY